MKSVINGLFPGDTPARRRSGLVSESQERILAHLLPLHHLGKTPEQVCCPYCKQTTKTRVEQSDSKATKRNIDHFCTSCNGHLAHKPYRGRAQAIPKDAIIELPLGQYHERTELAASPDHVSELYAHQGPLVQREADKEAVVTLHAAQSQASRILSPAELDWEVYQPPTMSDDQASVPTDTPQMEPLELLAESNPVRPVGETTISPLANARTLNTIKRKPVPSGSGQV